MPVRVIPVGVLKARVPEELVLQAAGRTVAAVLGEAGIQPDLVAMVLINGRQSAKDTVLRDGDVVKLVPFVGGG
jgi:sulfur carrier protein ThiS